MRLAGLEPEGVEYVEPGVHARDDREVQGRADVEVAARKGRREATVERQQVVHHAHQTVAVTSASQGEGFPVPGRQQLDGQTS